MTKQLESCRKLEVSIVENKFRKNASRVMMVLMHTFVVLPFPNPPKKRCNPTKRIEVNNSKILGAGRHVNLGNLKKQF